MDNLGAETTGNKYLIRPRGRREPTLLSFDNLWILICKLSENSDVTEASAAL